MQMIRRRRNHARRSRRTRARRRNFVHNMQHERLSLISLIQKLFLAKRHFTSALYIYRSLLLLDIYSWLFFMHWSCPEPFPLLSLNVQYWSYPVNSFDLAAMVLSLVRLSLLCCDNIACFHKFVLNGQ